MKRWWNQHSSIYKRRLVRTAVGLGTLLAIDIVGNLVYFSRYGDPIAFFWLWGGVGLSVSIFYRDLRALWEGRNRKNL